MKYDDRAAQSSTKSGANSDSSVNDSVVKQAGATQVSKAIFAAGCFWGVQYFFDMVPGVIKTTVGYSGGHTDNPEYFALHEDSGGHAEAILIEFDPSKTTYEILLKHFFRIHNPTALNAADGINIGEIYRSAIFYFNDSQKRLAEKARDEIQKMYKEPVVTEIKPAGKFWPAEAYHQKFTERTGRGMCHVAYAPLPEEAKKITD